MTDPAVAPVSPPPRPNRWLDQPDGYGWFSIFLHWTTALVIIVMWFIGDTIASDPSGAARRAHTTLAVSAYVLLALRVWWRLKNGHPRPLPTQSRLIYKLGEVMHFFMVGAIATAIVTGPLQALTSGQPLMVFDRAIPTFPAPAVFGLAHAIHGYVTDALMIAVCVHFLAVMKHVSMDRDGTFDRMLSPPEEPTPPTATIQDAAKEKGG